MTQSKTVLLLRGINVGGRNKLPMTDLKRLLEDAGASDVTTVIQSGNAVLSSEKAGNQLASTVGGMIEDQFGFRPDLLTMSSAEFLALMQSNPFPDAVSEPSTLHAFMATQEILLNQDALDKFKAESERIAAIGNALWLHAPNGIGCSKLVSNIRKLTGCETTARNWNTLSKLEKLVKQ